MATFKDNQNQPWNVKATLWKVRKVAEVLGLELFNPVHYQNLKLSLTDRMAYLFLLCEDQAKELQIDADEFEERLYGANISDNASAALFEEFESFARRLGQTALAKEIQADRRVMAGALELAKELVDSGKLDSVLEEQTAQRLNQLRVIAGIESPN